MKTMRNYTVMFEFYGKKMKTTVMAESDQHAKEIVRSKIIFHHVGRKPDDEFNEVVDILDKLSKIFKQ
jgi:hypothetical protein